MILVPVFVQHLLHPRAIPSEQHSGPSSWYHKNHHKCPLKRVTGKFFKQNLHFFLVTIFFPPVFVSLLLRGQKYLMHNFNEERFALVHHCSRFNPWSGSHKAENYVRRGTPWEPESRGTGKQH